MNSWSTCGGFFSAGCSQASFCSTLARMLRWSSVAPLETPVVPPVYCRKATSSSVSFGLLSFMPRPAASASLNETAPGIDQAGTIFFTLRTTRLTITPLKPSRSPMLPTITCLTAVFAITCCTVVAKFSSTTIASAPESLS